MEQNNENKIIFDININSLNDLYNILLTKSYDFFTLEPDKEKVTVSFRKSGKIVEQKFIKNSIYLEILTKAKTISGLDLWVKTEEQEGSWEVEVDGKTFNSLAKVVPGQFWEKLFLKLKVVEKKVKKEAKPINTWALLWFFWALLIVLLIVGWWFLAFVVLNAKTVDDVRFFTSLWVNLNQINNFIGNAVSIFFWTLTLILVIFLIIFIFKFLLTKKIFKKKKAVAWILTILFFILSFSSASTWLYLDKKIKNLPKWDIIALWDVQIFDNSIYRSSTMEKIYRSEKKLSDDYVVTEAEKKSYSILDSNYLKNLVWPAEIKFDVSQLRDKEESWRLKVETYVWTIWGETIETKIPTLIYNFKNKWIYNSKIKFIFNDGSEREFDSKTIPSIEIIWTVDIKENQRNNGSKQVTFNWDNETLRRLGSPEWYNVEKDEVNPISTKRIYITNSIFEEWLYKLLIKNWDKTIEKYFLIDWEKESDISGEIEFSRSVLDDKDFTFKVVNPKANEWIWIIEKYIWTIDGRQYTKKWDIDNPEKASEVNHSFLNYWKYDISVELIPTSWESRKLTKTVDISKELKIKEWLEFSVDWEKYENVIHNKNLWEYYINDFGQPAEISISSIYVKADNPLYNLREISWDYDSDWDIDSKERIWKINIIKDWKRKITVTYSFKNIRLDNDYITIKENIYIEAIKKEAIVKFKVNQRSEYAPTIIGFDASQSSIRDQNISKFIWDFGDGEKMEWDAIIQGHKYLTDWEYKVTLTVVTSSGEKYTGSKQIVLKPKAQKVKIKTSLKEAPIYQWINFDSSDSIGDIINYLWDFGDGETSTEANPNHSYKAPGKYKVKLTVDFRNKNIMNDEVEIKITE